MSKTNLAPEVSHPSTDCSAASPGTRSTMHALAGAEPLVASGLSRWLVAAYVAVCLPVALFYVVAVPAFDVADEPNHFLRAEQLTHGGMFGETGGLVDDGTLELLRLFPGMLPPPPENVVKAWQIPWRGRLSHGHFPNTVRYPPPGYLPQMLGITLGKALNLPVLVSVYLARFFNAVAMLAFSAWILLCCRRGAWMMAWVLTLPMLTDEMASCSQDAALICCSAAAAALVSHGTQLTRRRYYLLAAILTLCVSGRPPLVSLLLMLLLPAFSRSVGMRRQVLTTVVAFLGVAVWFTLSTSPNVVMMEGVNVKEQLRYVLSHPGAYARMAVDDFSRNGDNYWRGMVGLLGWQTTALSRLAYQCAMLALGLHAWALLAGLRPHSARRDRHLAAHAARHLPHLGRSGGIRNRRNARALLSDDLADHPVGHAMLVQSSASHV